MILLKTIERVGEMLLISIINLMSAFYSILLDII